MVLKRLWRILRNGKVFELICELDLRRPVCHSIQLERISTIGPNCVESLLDQGKPEDQAGDDEQGVFTQHAFLSGSIHFS